MASAIVVLSALAQETRLEVLRPLVERGPEGLPAGAIADALLPADEPHTGERRKADCCPCAGTVRSAA